MKGRARSRSAGSGRGKRMDQVEPEGALEQLPDEAGRLPFLLARRLGDLARLLLRWRASVRGLLAGWVEDVSHGRGPGEGGGQGARESGDPWSTRSDDVPLRRSRSAVSSSVTPTAGATVRA